VSQAPSISCSCACLSLQENNLLNELRIGLDYGFCLQWIPVLDMQWTHGCCCICKVLLSFAARRPAADLNGRYSRATQGVP
jgi:hypothetical protein